MCSLCTPSLPCDRKGVRAGGDSPASCSTGSTVATRVIACLDVDAGRVVKGVNFANLRDAGDPVELAKLYDSQGVDELTFLDVTASSGNRETTYDVVRRTAEQVFIPLTVGGGVRSVADVRQLLADRFALVPLAAKGARIMRYRLAPRPSAPAAP